MAWQGHSRSPWRSFTKVHSGTKTYRHPNDSFLRRHCLFTAQLGFPIDDILNALESAFQRPKSRLSGSIAGLNRRPPCLLD
jgi:hypothetical protein